MEGFFLIAFNTVHSLVQQYRADGYVGFELGECELRRAHLSLQPPAAPDDVRRCEDRLGALLPPEYREFLQTWNGGHLYRSGRYTIQLCGTEELVALHVELARVHSDRCGSGIIAFAYLPGTGGDYLAFGPDGSVLDGHQSLSPADWPQRRIAGDFRAWVDRLITGRGYYYWMAESFQA